jgi:hypothetical protein
MRGFFLEKSFSAPATHWPLLGCIRLSIAFFSFCRESIFSFYLNQKFRFIYFILCIVLITNVTYASLFIMSPYPYCEEFLFFETCVTRNIIELLQKFTKRCQTQTQTAIGIGEKDLNYASVFLAGLYNYELKI